MWRSFASWSLSMTGYLISICRHDSGRGSSRLPSGPDRRAHRRHQLLADGVERRVGHLREQLLEVVVEQPRPIRQHRQRRVGAHRADRLFAVVGHRRQQQAQILVRVAERLLAAAARVSWLGRRQIRRRRQILDVDQVLGQPLRVGMRRREIALDLLVGDDAALHGVDQEDPARVQPLLEQDVLRRDVEHADLGRHDDEVVLRHVVARRPQAVAIEHRADHRAVGEGDRRRAVPRLHQRRVVLVERLQLRPHALVARPRLRESSSGWRAAATGPVITRNSRTLSKVAVSLPPSRMIGRIFFRSSPSSVRAQQPLARAHPVDVAAQRVDLAVVRDVAVRVRQRPRRERVRAEALVHQRQRRLDVGIGQIGERAVDLIGDQHPFVDQRLRRQARACRTRAARSARSRSASCSTRLRMTYSFRSNGSDRAVRPPCPVRVVPVESGRARPCGRRRR